MNLNKFRNPESAFMHDVVYYPTCGTTIPDPQCSDCPDKELAGIRGYFLQKETYSFTDYTDIAEWNTAINNKDVFLYPKSRGSLEQTPTEGVGYGDIAVSMDGSDFVLSVFDPNFVDNVDHWNQMKKANNYKVGWRTETKLYVSDDSVGIIPMAPVVEDVKAHIPWNIQFKFAQEDYPTPYDIPATLFDQCVAVS